MLDPIKLPRFVLSTMLLGLLAACTGSPTTPTSPVAPGVCADLAASRATGVFTYNRDYRRRDEILGIQVDWASKNSGGVEWFDRASLEQIATVYLEGFLDPSDQQNYSPTAGELLAFMCTHPAALASGYVVDPNREDYRVTIDAMELPEGSLDQESKQELLQLCMYADEFSGANGLYCWWD